MRKQLEIKNLSDSQYESLLFLGLIGWQQKVYTEAILKNKSAGLATFVRLLFHEPENQPLIISQNIAANVAAVAKGIEEYTPPGEDASAMGARVAQTSRLIRDATLAK